MNEKFWILAFLSTVLLAGAYCTQTEKILPGQQMSPATAGLQWPNAHPPYDEAPRLLQGREPDFPAVTTPHTKSGGVLYDALLRFTIDKDGRTSHVQVVKSSDTAYDHAAIVAIQNWKFKPALKNGRPIAVTYTVPFTYGY